MQVNHGDAFSDARFDRVARLHAELEDLHQDLARVFLHADEQVGHLVQNRLSDLREMGV